MLLRGAWEKPGRLSLLRNKGDGVFEDVTLASGLGEPISSESAVWGDYDNDGWLDLFVCGEIPRGRDPDPRERCRLYHNQHDGTFKDVAPEAGVAGEGSPRARPGAIMMATADSTCSSRTWTSPAASTITRATASSVTSPRSWVSPGRPTSVRSPAGSGTTTTTAGSTSS